MVLYTSLCSPDSLPTKRPHVTLSCGSRFFYKNYIFASSVCNTSKSGNTNCKTSIQERQVTKISCFSGISYNGAICKGEVCVSNPYPCILYQRIIFFFFSLQIPDFGVSIVFFFFNFHLLVKSHLLKHLEAAQNLALSKTCIIAAVLEIKTEIHSLRCDPNVLTVAEVEWVFIITSVVWRLEKVVSFGI